MLELDTPHGPARAHLHPAGEARGALVLGDGAGGGGGAPDLVLATEVANGLGITVALVEQPYRVAGRRSTPAAISSTMRGSPCETAVDLAALVIDPGQGFTALEVSIALRCTPTFVRRARVAAGRDAERGRIVQVNGSGVELIRRGAVPARGGQCAEAQAHSGDLVTLASPASGDARLRAVGDRR